MRQFVPLKKAYDSIDRNMFAVLQHYGIPEDMVNVESALYDKSKRAVMVDGNISDPVEISTCVLEGDVLALFLFIILVDFPTIKATADASSGVVTHPVIMVIYPFKISNDFDFADDIGLLESSKLQT